MASGFMFGLSESCSSIVSGLFCKYFSSSQTMTGAHIIFIFAISFFYFGCGGVFGSIPSFVAVFCQVLGCGSMNNVIYLLTE